MQWYYTLTFLVLILACKNEKKNTSLVSSRNLIHDTISELFILDTAQSIVYWQGSNWKILITEVLKLRKESFF